MGSCSTSSDDTLGELRLAEGVIAEVADAIEPGLDDEVIDARGCVIVPGLVDLQAHLREPGDGHVDSIETGTAAAAQGGITAMVSMPNTSPCIDQPDLVRFVNETARAVGWCDVMSSAAMSRNRDGDEPTDVEALYEAGARLFTDDGTAVMDSAVVREVMERVAALPGAYVGQHAEDEALVAGGHINEGIVSRQLGIRGRPAVAEVAVVARDLLLAELTGARYHVLHASCVATLDLVERARARGVDVTVEVTPQHLAFTEEALLDGDALFKMNPPLRTAADRSGRIELPTGCIVEQAAQRCGEIGMADHVGDASDYGVALGSLWHRFASLLRSSTTVLILGDGRSGGRDPGFAHVDALVRRCRRTVWWTPEAEGAWSFGNGEMTEYAERVDAAMTVRTLDDLLGVARTGALRIRMVGRH